MGMGLWLQVVEAAAAKLVPEWLDWVKLLRWWQSGNGTGKEGVKQDRMIGVLLVYTLCSSCPGSACWQKLVRLISINPLLIRYSIRSQSWILRCSRLFHFRLPSSYCTVPGDLSSSDCTIPVSCLWSCCKRTLLLDNVPFKQLGVFLFVGVPDIWCILQRRAYHRDSYFVYPLIQSNGPVAVKP